MFHVRDNFNPGAPISQVPASWFNKVGAFINNLIGGKGVRVIKNENAPSVIELVGDDQSSNGTPSEMETPTATVYMNNSGNIPSGHQRNALITNTVWKRGEVDSSGVPRGVKVYLPTDSWDTGALNCLAWRRCEFDGDGHLKSIEGQSILTFALSAEQ